jgi:hypothetical protein
MKAIMNADGTPQIPRGYELSKDENKFKIGSFYFVAATNCKKAHWQTMHCGKSASKYVLVPKGKKAVTCWVQK